MKLKNLFPIAILFLLLSASCNKNDTIITPTPTPVAETITMNVAYGTDPLQKMDIYLPANRSITTTKVLVYIHGGAWVGGDKSDLNGAGIDSIRKRLPDYAVFNVNYRLAALPVPATNPFPTQEMDIKAAIEFINLNRATFLVSDKFVLMGHSAGGHLALLYAYKYQIPYKIKAVVDFFGPTNMVTMYSDYASNPAGQFGLAALMGGTPTSNPALYQSSSPFTYATTSNACPTIILQGGTDVVVYPSQSTTLRDKLTSAGVVNQYVFYPLLPHGPWNAATNTDAMNKIVPFLAANVQ